MLLGSAMRQPDALGSRSVVLVDLEDVDVGSIREAGRVLSDADWFAQAREFILQRVFRAVSAFWWSAFFL